MIAFQENVPGFSYRVKFYTKPIGMRIRAKEFDSFQSGLRMSVSLAYEFEPYNCQTITLDL